MPKGWKTKIAKILERKLKTTKTYYTKSG